MKTTLEFEEGLIKRAKQRAAEDGESLTALIHRALRAYLHPPAPERKPFRLRLLTKNGRALPGVDWDDRDSLYERMEGRS
jgi:plasmid stability protein